MSEILPGSSSGDAPPRQINSIDKTAALLDEAADDIIDVEASLTDAGSRALDDAAADYAYLSGDLAGGASNQLDDAQRTVTRLQQHLYQQPINLLQEGYGHLAAMGYDVPTMEEVRHANTTGDYIRTDKPGWGYEKPCSVGKPGLPIPGVCDADGNPPSPSGTPYPPSDGTGPPTDTTGPIVQPPYIPVPPVDYTSPVPPVIPPTGTTPIPPGGSPPIPPGVIEDGADNGGPADDAPVLPFDPENPCDPGWRLVGFRDGRPLCVPMDEVEPPVVPLPPPVIGPPIIEVEPPIPDVIVPVGPPPTLIDPTTCTYGPDPTVVVECVTVPPPPKPPAPWWIRAECDGCGWKVCLLRGDERPEASDGQVVYGPFSSRPNPQSYMNGVCDIQVGPPDDDDEDADDEDEDIVDDDDTPDDETPADEEDDEEEPPTDPLPAPEQRPLPGGQDKYCAWIGEVSDNAAGMTPSFDVAVGLAPAETTAGSVAQAVPRLWLGLMASLFNGTVKMLVTKARQAIEGMSRGLDCDRGKMIPIALTLGGLNAIQKYLGFVPKQTIAAVTQASNTVCQSEIPGKSEADVAYLRGDIDKETWECWVKANGDYLEPAKKVMESQRAKLDPAQIDWLFRRKYIGRPQYEKLMREAGVLFDEDKKNIHDYNTVWPSLADTTRLMTRDVGDERNIDWRASDREFGDKYKGKMKEYFDALGVPEELARDYWRAHWHIPSFTMLTEMLHRLQNDMVGPDLMVGITQVKNALMQDDWHPDWVDKMIAISYKAVTKTDATRAYMIHASDDETLHRQFRATGYTDDDAFFYLEYYKKLRKIQDLRRSGYPTLRTLANQYARCEITDTAYRDTVSKIVITEEQGKNAIDAAMLSRETRQRQQAIKSIRRPYILGLFDDGQANQALAEAGVDPSCISGLIDNWKLDRLRRDKYLTAETLCGMRERGILDAASQLLALIRAGWRREEAQLIVSNCGAIISEKNARKADTLARRQAADQKKAQKEMERLRRIQECGPAPCPPRRSGNTRPSEVRPQNQGPSSSGTAATSRPPEQPPDSGK